MSEPLLPLAQVDFPLEEIRLALRDRGAMPNLARVSSDVRFWGQVGQLLVSQATHHDRARRRVEGVAHLAPHLDAHQALHLTMILVNHRSLIDPFPWAAWLPPLLARIPKQSTDLSPYMTSEAVLGALHRNVPDPLLRDLLGRVDWTASAIDTYNLGREAFLIGHAPRLFPRLQAELARVNQRQDHSLLADVLLHKAHRDELVQKAPEVATWLLAHSPSRHRGLHLIRALIEDKPDQARFLFEHGSAPVPLPISAYFQSRAAQDAGHTVGDLDRSLCLALYHDHWPAVLREWLTEAAWPVREALPQFHDFQLARYRALDLQARPAVPSRSARRRA